VKLIALTLAAAAVLPTGAAGPAAAPPANPLLVSLRTQSSSTAVCPAEVSFIGSVELVLPPGWRGTAPKIAYQFTDDAGWKSQVRYKQPYAATSYFVVAQARPPDRPASRPPTAGWVQLTAWWNGATATSGRAPYRLRDCR